MPFRSARAGTLPGVADVVLGGARLPEGTLVTPDPSFTSKPSREPVLWITRSPVENVGELWRAVAGGFATYGLWPLVLESLHGEDDRPWLAGELDPPSSSSPDEHDPRAVMEEQWAQVVPESDEDAASLAALQPYGRKFPGMARASEQAPDAGTADRVTAPMQGRLGLVPVARPADVLAAIGWSGPVNHYGDMGVLSAVLRSWEDRFGAFVVAVGFDTLTLAVERPPMTLDHALAVSAEHHAMCPDNIHQGAGSLQEYAGTIVEQRVWMFWWD